MKKPQCVLWAGKYGTLKHHRLEFVTYLNIYYYTGHLMLLRVKNGHGPYNSISNMTLVLNF